VLIITILILLCVIPVLIVALITLIVVRVIPVEGRLKIPLSIILASIVYMVPFLVIVDDDLPIESEAVGFMYFALYSFAMLDDVEEEEAPPHRPQFID